MILQSEISKLAHKLGLSDRTIEKDYVLTWVLHAIANSPLYDQMAFKGGTALKKIYVPKYRFSEDLDFTILASELTNAQLEVEIKSLFPWLKRETNLTLEIRKVDIHSSGNPAFYVNYIGPLQGHISSRFLKMDFTRGEILAYPLQNLPVQSTYSDLQNRRALLHVYSLEEILAEKLRSLLTRTEPRDLYDAHYILVNQIADVDQMIFSMSQKFEPNGFAISDLNTILLKREETFKRLWRGRLEGQMPEIPSLETVIRETKRYFRQYF
ncbi:MAG: nucleotidyl transferase AbiEii/AbiGii toxin family protein [Chloroflexota bacterium]|nr:nucleotidyl transferase AbiEii/AbiGii toxin family protein [Chloroflexota bacterium]